MITCRNCKHFNRDDGDWKGFCDIQLPPWLTVVIQELSESDNRFTRVDGGCDLGELKE